MCLMQFGHLPHDQVMASIRRVGEAPDPRVRRVPDEERPHERPEQPTRRLRRHRHAAPPVARARPRSACSSAQGARCSSATSTTRRAQALADELGDAAVYAHLDVRSEDDWRAALDAAVARVRRR